MLFVINKIKYDTDKMDLISNKCRYYKCLATNEVFLYKSKKDNWLLVYKEEKLKRYTASPLSEEEAQELLLKYDVLAYEKLFGELEEA